MARPTALLIDLDLLKHRHNILIQDLPGLNTTLSLSQGYPNDTNIGKVMVKFRHNQEERSSLFL